MKLKEAAKPFRACALKCLKKAATVEYHPDDLLNALLTDPLADLIKAAHAQGYSREKIKRAIWSGAMNGWTECREGKIEESEAEGEGVRFADDISRGGSSPRLCEYGSGEGVCVLRYGHEGAHNAPAVEAEGE